MSFMVKGIDLPSKDKSPLVITVWADGIVRCVDSCGGIEETTSAIQIDRPHGRIADVGFEEMHYTSMTTNPTPDVTEQDKANSVAIVRALQMAHTILEAEE